MEYLKRYRQCWSTRLVYQIEQQRTPLLFASTFEETVADGLGTPRPPPRPEPRGPEARALVGWV